MAYSAEEIAELRETLALYRAAERDILRNQAYEMPDGRKLTRADLKEVRAGVAEARRELAAATGTTRAIGRARRGVVM